jgi:thiamine kinase-like enzyme
MREFYNVTKDFEVEEDLRLLNYAKDIKKKNLGVLNNIFEKTLDRVKKNKKEERLLIVDINSSNFIETKSDIYMIDFDEILFGEIEFDLADFFTDFFEREKQSLKEIIEIYKEFLSYFDNYSYDVDKILDYIILILISELTPNTKDSENEYKLRGVKFILANRKIIYDMLKK